MRHMFTFARVGWWNIIQVRMLHRNSIQLCCGTDDSVAVKRHKVQRYSRDFVTGNTFDSHSYCLCM